MKKAVKILIILLILILLGVATFFSIFKFYVFNPFSSCFGMLQILFTSKEYTTVQNFPKKVIFCKSQVGDRMAKDFLNEYMKKRGFEELEEEQMGATLVYSDGKNKEYVSYTINAYYSQWNWK